MNNFQRWELEKTSKPKDWIDNHFPLLMGFVIIAASVFCFICGVVVGKVQPSIYRWVLQVIGLG